jgi:nitrogenase molybdenum-iron protein beta chain
MGGYMEQPRFSCALAAQMSVLAIPYAHPIVHAGPGCAEKTFMFSCYGSGFQGEGFAGGGTVSSTNTTERDVVFGGEEKLKQYVAGALKVLKGDLYVIMSGCTSGIVGDDVVYIAGSYAKEGFPVVGVETSGFKGNAYFGHELLMREIINQFVGDVNPQVRKGLVNVFSVVPSQHPFWRADLEEIKRILTAIGLEVNILFGYESEGVSEWKDIPNAQFNLVLSSWVGLDTVELLESKYGTPYLHIPYLPVGAEATSRALREIGQFAGLDQTKVESVIQREERKFYRYFVSLADFIADYRNNIPFELYAVADSSYALGVSDYLVNELGLAPEGIYITDDPEQKRQAELEKALLALAPEFEGKLRFEVDGGIIQRDMRKKLGNSNKALIMGSTWEDVLAGMTGNLSVHLSLPVHNDVFINRSFVGYTGGLRLTEEVYAGAFRKGNITKGTLVAKTASS